MPFGRSWSKSNYRVLMLPAAKNYKFDETWEMIHPPTLDFTYVAQCDFSMKVILSRTICTVIENPSLWLEIPKACTRDSCGKRLEMNISFVRELFNLEVSEN